MKFLKIFAIAAFASLLQSCFNSDDHIFDEAEAININVLEKQIKRADIYVAVTPFKQENFPIPVFSGMAFLTGFGQEAELKKIIEEINK